ncbi:hypothetical protein HYFRA_00001061 [Hymenoscyphus fraxineus]|uniref:N-acetylgalactosaminide beta-1,3-galactosyltransferase n=1 Tax=Hymenoscyphus fraxineus TaxID=746836 RepID=A0A9N9KRR8_9HELO|nr:hypothetical protein HYFRA_00001061 [Hymenoscyphus fraxineus]
MLRCVDDLLLFSDLEQHLGSHYIHDVLKNVAEEVKANNPDFDYYRTLQEYKKNGEDIRKIKEHTHEAGWNLDKYKFIRMLEETWKMKPGKKWYVFIEADTYLVWTNLLLWLDRLKSTQPLYFGSPAYYDEISFSHGGSGYVLSGAALSKFSENNTELVARYDTVAQMETYGDFVLTKALMEQGIEFTHKWPLLQGEKPSTIPFGPGPDSGTRHWCQPIITMHHVNPEETNSIWLYESERPDVKKPLLIGDLYRNLTKPYMIGEREDWFNLSDDVILNHPEVEGSTKTPEEMSEVEKEAHLSYENCRKACDEDSRLGERRPPQDGVVYKSGWNIEKIEKDQAENPCVYPNWM